MNVFEPDSLAVDTQDLDLVLECPLTEPLDAPVVRRRIRQILAGGWLEPRTHEVTLASTELIANALRHGAPPARFRLLLGAERAFAAAFDAGEGAPCFDPTVPLPTMSANGRGLFLVQAESDNCGAYTIGSRGKWVYAEWLRAPDPT